MRLILALNAIGPIPAAFGLIILGGGFMVLFKVIGLAPEDVKTGHDIVIAGISFISGMAVASRTMLPTAQTTTTVISTIPPPEKADPTVPVTPAKPK